jgi:hypothetical protein
MALDSVVKSYLTSSSDFCAESGFNYFAYSIFDEDNRFLLSYCNNLDWLTIFQHDFFPHPPVKDIVMLSKQPLEIWDPDRFDSDSACYIKKRNDVCQTRFMVTFLLRLKKQLTAVTLGSPHDLGHFYQFYDHQQHALDRLFKKSLRFSASIQHGYLSTNDE